MALIKALSPVVDLIYPPRCPACGTALAAQAGLCAGCWGDLVMPGAMACRGCALPMVAAADDDICGTCRETPPHHDGLAAATLYTEGSRRLLLGFKHGRKLALAPVMARLMAARLAAMMPEIAEQPWLLVPVPLHRWRLWRRGYNQSAVLGEELARLTGARLVRDGLHRTRRTPSLGGLGREARAQVLDGAIVAARRRADMLAGARVVLVDDVLTSGATTNACIAALRQAGAAQVVVTCFARVAEGIK